MQKINYVNEDTLKEIENYLSISNPPGLVLAGIPGLGKAQAARYAASRLLHCRIDELTSNPDFYETKSDTFLKVEDVEQILTASQRCSIGERKVFILHHADTITRGTQNRLLKLLEDQGEKNILILLTDHFSLIPTIMSRCFLIRFHPLGHLKMHDCLREQGIGEKYYEFLSFLLENAPYHVISENDRLSDYMELNEKIEKLTMRQDLFSILNALIEKDSQAFFDTHNNHPARNIRLVLFPFHQMLLNFLDNGSYTDNRYPYNLYSVNEAYKIMEKGQEHLHLVQGNYTKNDYFNLLRFIVQIK